MKGVLALCCVMRNDIYLQVESKSEGDWVSACRHLDVVGGKRKGSSRKKLGSVDGE